MLKQLEISLFVKVAFYGLIVALAAQSEVSVDMNWDSEYKASDKYIRGTLVTDSVSEVPKLKESIKRAAMLRNAVPPGPRGEANLDLGFRLFIDKKKFYVKPALFMAKQFPDEICNPVDFENTPVYKCEEGQNFARSCHLFIFDSTFSEVGFHTVRISEPWPMYCNAVPAVGTGDKKRNELLVTVQYFPLDRKAASQISQIGAGWSRMTVLLRVKADSGRVEIEQDDDCLGNPNKLETIPDARRRLKKCLIKP